MLALASASSSAAACAASRHTSSRSGRGSCLWGQAPGSRHSGLCGSGRISGCAASVPDNGASALATSVPPQMPGCARRSASSPGSPSAEAAAPWLQSGCTPRASPGTTEDSARSAGTGSPIADCNTKMPASFSFFSAVSAALRTLSFSSFAASSWILGKYGSAHVPTVPSRLQASLRTFHILSPSCLPARVAHTWCCSSSSALRPGTCGTSFGLRTTPMSRSSRTAVRAAFRTSRSSSFSERSLSN
mmetsp:Transcript_80359/g.260344  ORF Transcript_80359/g.260344 Transcript_80359/m.260344 type:complete len:246 (-) Transcript_80359:246-983(-)